jgi:thioredoxin reductase (NADPH)
MDHHLPEHTPAALSQSHLDEMASPLLSEDMLTRLRGYGEELRVSAGAKLFGRSERDVDMFVVLEGTLDVYALDQENLPRLINRKGRGGFTGEQDLISSRQVLAEGFATTDCHLLRVCRREIARLLRCEGDIANLITQAALWRRIKLLQVAGAGIVLVGNHLAADTARLQRFLFRNSYPHRLLAPEELHTDQAAEMEAASLGEFPSLIFPDGEVLRRPSIARLAEKLGLAEHIEPGSSYDIVIVGAGPAGLATAVYAASEGLSILVIEGFACGGQAGTSSRIENFLGFPTGISGMELANLAQIQALKFGARLAISKDVVGIRSEGGIHHVTTCDGVGVRARSVVIATGAAYRKLDVPDYPRYENQGIHYAATAMEAKLCKQQVGAVIGGGNSAGQAALFLARFAAHVHLVVRRGNLTDTMSSYLISRITSTSNITVHHHCAVERLEGDSCLEFASWRNLRTGVLTRERIGAMFVLIGAEPNTRWLGGAVRLDARGFIGTGAADAFENSRYATNVAGIYAVGDVRSGSTKRVASAVGEGSVVIADVHRYLSAHEHVEAESHSVLAALQASHHPADQHAARP